MANHEGVSDIVGRLFPGAELAAMQRLAGGVSADVHRLDVRLADGRTNRVVLRAHRPTHSGHPAALEYQLLQVLHRNGVRVPEPLLVDASGDLLADPFLIMEFVDGSTEIPVGRQDRYIDAMAKALAAIHAMPIAGLPELPARNNPLPEVFDFLPEGSEWESLRTHLLAPADTGFTGTPVLLHGDFWPGNLLWRNGSIAAILDWEDAAIGDPLSDVACCRVELRYQFGSPSMERFTRTYASHRDVDPQRLALWQVYVAAAAQRYMGEWGLEPEREAHMRREALASIREARDVLMERSPGLSR